MSIPADVQADELSKCLFNESNDAFFVVDPAELRITAVNPAAQRLSGYSQAELEGVLISDLLVGETGDAVAELLEGCRETRFIHSQDGFRLKCKNRVIDANISLSRLHGEMRTWSLIVLRDITDRKELERSLKHSNDRYRNVLEELKTSRETIILQEQIRAISLLSSGIAHDLNNLLTPIVTLSSLLMTNSELDPSIRQNLDVIEKSALGAADSVRRLSRYKAVDDCREVAVALGPLINDLSYIARLQLRSSNEKRGKMVDFSVDVDDSLPAVRGTEAGIRQVLLNLVFNAIDASEDGGSVAVQATSLDRGVAVEISDNGVGMEPETLERCFEAFFTTKPEGTGIGLSISQATLESYGGRIEAESRPGSGSTFRFWLPESVESHEVPQGSGGRKADTVEGLSVLCVEDEAPVRVSLVALLEAMGADVDQAADGATGISKIRAQHYDAVITDLWMEGVSGWDVVQEARRNSDPIPVCILSGWEEAEVIRQAPPGVRPDRILTKPIVASRLSEFLADVARTNSERA